MPTRPCRAAKITRARRNGHAHRSAVAPSVRPDERPYRWTRPDGTDAGEGERPSPADLPELPAASVVGLTANAREQTDAKAKVGA
ncbi:MAG: hypothetical protein ACM3UV_00695, partial [Nocardioidaceae bacterium]